VSDAKLSDHAHCHVNSTAQCRNWTLTKWTVAMAAAKWGRAFKLNQIGFLHKMYFYRKLLKIVLKSSVNVYCTNVKYYIRDCDFMMFINFTFIPGRYKEKRFLKKPGRYLPILQYNIIIFYSCVYKMYTLITAIIILLMTQ